MVSPLAQMKMFFRAVDGPLKCATCAFNELLLCSHKNPQKQVQDPMAAFPIQSTQTFILNELQESFITPAMTAFQGKSN